MGWTNEQATEITAPGNVPFQPGFDVMGIGSQLPPELQGSVVRTALVMYNSSWSATATKPTVKFHFLGTAAFSNGTGLVIGMGSCPNPSVSTTAIVALNIVFMYPNDNSSDVFFLWQDSQNGVMQQIIETSFATGAVQQQGFNGSTGTQLWKLPGTTLPGPN